MEYSGLLWLVLTSLPNATLTPLLSRLNADSSGTTNNLGSTQWFDTAESSLRNVVVKESMQWRYHVIFVLL